MYKPSLEETKSWNEVKKVYIDNPSKLRELSYKNSIPGTLPCSTFKIEKSIDEIYNENNKKIGIKKEEEKFKERYIMNCFGTFIFGKEKERKNWPEDYTQEKFCYLCKSSNGELFFLKCQYRSKLYDLFWRLSVGCRYSYEYPYLYDNKFKKNHNKCCSKKRKYLEDFNPCKPTLKCLNELLEYRRYRIKFKNEDENDLIFINLHEEIENLKEILINNEVNLNYFNDDIIYQE